MTIYDEVQKAIYSTPEDADQFQKDVDFLCEKWKINRKTLIFAITLLTVL